MAYPAPSPAQPTGPSPDLRTLNVPWTGRDVFTGIVWFIAIFIAGQIAVVVFAVADRSTTSAGTYAAAFVLGAAVEVGIAIAAYSLSAGRYGGGIERLGVRPPNGATFLWAAAALVGALAISIIYGVFIQVFHLHGLESNCAEQIPSGVRSTRWLLALASLVVIAFAPVCEELFFRGFVFPGLAKAWGVGIAVVVSALLFSSAHLDYKSFIPIAGVGMVFAFCYWRSGNILSTMTAHCAFNSTSIAFIAGGSCDSIAGHPALFYLADFAASLTRVHL